MARPNAPSSSTGSARGLALALTPAGALVLTERSDAELVDPAVADRVRAAFGRGAGHGLLHLGAAELDTPLPPGIAFWRDLGHAFVAHLCAQPELESERKRLRLDFPDAEVTALAAGAPPMPGGEYLDRGVLAALWDGMNEACRIELAAFDGSAEAYLQTRHPVW